MSMRIYGGHLLWKGKKKEKDLRNRKRTQRILFWEGVYRESESYD
jgi:hypothetical protein